MSKGTILNIKQFEIHDGPGMRTTLFVKGCPLRCKWCHNPESYSIKPQLAYYAHKCVMCGRCTQVCTEAVHLTDGSSHTVNRELCTACGACVDKCPQNALTVFGREVSPKEILPELLEDKIFFDGSGGGVTISGGEPLMQADFTAELLMLLKENGVHTAVDTCLFAPKSELEKLLEYTDLFLVDIKAIDDNVHKRCTGVSNRIILENLQYIDSVGKAYEIRIPYIPHENDGEIQKIADFLCSLKNTDRVKLLAYHDLSRSKYEALDMPYAMGATSVPSEEEYERAFRILTDAGLNAIHK